MSVGELVVSIVGDMSKLSSVFSKVNDDIGKVGNSFTSFGSSIGSKVVGTLETVGKYATIAGTAIGAAGLTGSVYKSVTSFRDFEQAVANAASVVGKTGDAYNQAKQNIAAVAQELGQKTVFSSSQAADAMYNLASAGYDVSTMAAKDLTPMLNLASGTQADLAETTNFTASTLSQFGLGFESAGRVADVYAKAIGVSQANMEKLSYSMNYVGPIANSMNMSLEKTVGALSTLYNAGMKGEQAGTGLRNILSTLAAPTSKAADALAAMGIKLEDVNPATHDLTDIIQLLADKGLDSATAFKIFGDVGAPAILSLTSKVGDLKSLTSALNDAGGAAQTMADQQLDTLSGSLEALSGSIENLFINVGGALAPTIRQVAKYLDSMMPSIQDFIVGVTTTFVSFIGSLDESVGYIGTIAETIIEVLGNIFKSFTGTSLSGGLADVINGIMNRIAGIVLEIAPIIQGAITSIITFFRNLVTGLTPTYNSIKSIAIDILSVFKAFFSGLSGPDSKGAASSISGVVNSISAVLASLSKTVSSALISAAPAIKSAFLTIVKTIQGYYPTLKAVWDKISSAFTKLNIDKVIKDLQPTWDNLKSSFESVKKIVEGFIKDLSPTWDNLKSSFDSAKTIIENFISALSGTDTDKAVTTGKDLADVINIITGAISGILKFAADHPTITNMVIAVAGLAAAFVTLAPAIAGVLGFLGTIATGLGMVAGAVGTVVTAIGAEGLAGGLGVLIAESFPGVAAAILFVAESVLPVIISGLGLLITPIGLIGVAVAALALAWATNWGGIRDKAYDIWNKLSTQAGVLYNSLGESWNKIVSSLGTLRNNFSTKLEDIKSLISTKWENIKTTISTKITEIITSVEKKITDFKNAGIKLIQGIIDGITSKANDLLTTAQKFMSDPIGAAKEWASGNAKNAGTTIGSNVVQGMNSQNNNARAAGSSLTSSAISGLSSVVSSAWSSGASIANSVANGIRSGIGYVASAASSLASTISAYLPHSPAKMGPLSKPVDFTSILVDPFSASIKDATALVSPLQNALSQIRDPLSIGGISGGLATLSNITNNSTLFANNDNSTYTYDMKFYPSSQLDMQQIINAVNQDAVRNKRARGY